MDRLTSTQDREETRYDPPDVESSTFADGSVNWLGVREDCFVRFLIETVVVGIGIGIGVATLILLTDMFGLSTLMRGQSMHLPPIAFILGGAMVSTPLSLALAVGLTAREK